MMTQDERNVTTRARVIVTVEVLKSGVWGGDCSMAQVFKQARDEAVGHIQRVFAESGERPGVDFNILATQVTAVSTTGENR